MLPDSPDVRDVVFGTDGLAGSMKSGSLLIDMSTISPAVAVEIGNTLGDQGAAALDARGKPARQCSVYAQPCPDVESVWSAWEALATPVLSR